MREYPQFEDLGLWPEEDRTEDLRPGKKNAPGVAATTSEGDQNRSTTK